MAEVPAPDAAQDEYSEHRAALERLRRDGWRPRCVYDIGASNGCWSSIVWALFPLAEFHLFEPLAEIDPSYKQELDRLRSQAGLRLTVHPIALDRTESTVPFGVSPDPVGSSLLAPVASQWFPNVVEVETAVLDTYREKLGLPVADLIKIDTQGSELRILEGAQRTLEHAQVLILEAWLARGYGPATPLLHELIDWLSRRGFLVRDFAGEYRDEKGHLFAKDLVFARADLLPLV